MLKTPTLDWSNIGRREFSNISSKAADAEFTHVDASSCGVQRHCISLLPASWPSYFSRFVVILPDCLCTMCLQRPSDPLGLELGDCKQ